MFSTMIRIVFSIWLVSGYGYVFYYFPLSLYLTHMAQVIIIATCSGKQQNWLRGFWVSDFYLTLNSVSLTSFQKKLNFFNFFPKEVKQNVCLCYIWSVTEGVSA